MTGVDRGTRLIAFVVLMFGLVVTLLPIALMVVNAFKASAQILADPIALPRSPHIENFANAWHDAHLGRAMRNSAIVSLIAIGLTCVTASMAAYAITRRRLRGRTLFSAYFLASTTLPLQLFLLPLYFGFAQLGLINNLAAVSLIYTAIYTPFAIFLLRTYFIALPAELEDAALMDGATSWQVFTRVMLPVVSPGILTVAIIVGLYTWNEFLIATTFLQGRAEQTAIVSFYGLGGQYSSDWGEIMAAGVIIVVPVVGFFLLLQRHFIDGMAGGSVKG